MEALPFVRIARLRLLLLGKVGKRLLTSNICEILAFLDGILFFCIKHCCMHPIIQNQLQAIKMLCKQCKVKSLYSFGSVNTSGFTDKSDIDLLIDFESDISIEDYTNNFFFLRERFANLFERDVDLVTRRSLSNPFFIQDVEQSKILIYGQS